LSSSDISVRLIQQDDRHAKVLFALGLRVINVNYGMERDYECL